MGDTRLHTCILCEAVCGVELTVDANRITSVRGDKNDPFSRGHICPKAAALGDVAGDPDRVREPLRRNGDRWVPVSWDSALSEATERLAAIQKEHGRSSVALYFGNPAVHSYSALLAAPIFGKLFGTRSRFSATSIDQLPQMLASYEMFGHQYLLPIPDVDRTHHMLIIGANPVISNGSIMTAPGIKGRLEAIVARGGKVVVVDPRRTETAELASAHHFIVPGTDAFLLLAILNTIFEERLERPGRLAAFTDGIDDVRHLARAFPAERVERRIGIDAAAIRSMAREFATAPSAACYGRVGLCTQDFGGLAAWLVMVLNIVTGQLDREGGVMFTTPAVDTVGLGSLLRETGHFGVWKSRVRGLPEFNGELPVAVMAEEMETPGPGQIRGLVTFAGNPVLSAPNGARLDRALANLDFMVAIDIYRNETTRHASLILPTTFGPEREHYDVAFYSFSVRNAARYVAPAIAPPPAARSDWQILFDLAIGLVEKGGGRPDRALGLIARAARAVGPTRILDLLLRTGPQGLRRGKRMSLARLRAHPHGMDLGPLERRLPSILNTRGRRIVLAPGVIVKDLPRLEAQLEEPLCDADELLLVGRRQLRSNNSWMHNSLRLVKGRPACTLLLHPDDAVARNLATGDPVVITSRRGQVETTVEVTKSIARGVVSLPHGWGHGRPGTGQSIAGQHPGVSLNDLTDDDRVDALCGNASFSGVPVKVHKAVPQSEKIPAIAGQ